MATTWSSKREAAPVSTFRMFFADQPTLARPPSMAVLKPARSRSLSLEKETLSFLSLPIAQPWPM
ncbi:MAG: hypothetical protein Q7T97_07940 [Burkholderiaceae bacterium]|nr:hypothetical protein [Burkholderiaceae bacterium]